MRALRELEAQAAMGRRMSGVLAVAVCDIDEVVTTILGQRSPTDVFALRSDGDGDADAEDGDEDG